MVTSNLNDGELIPQLLNQFGDGDWDQRMIDLFEIAEPTAAVRQLSDEYAAVRRRVFSKLSQADETA